MSTPLDSNVYFTQELLEVIDELFGFMFLYDVSLKKVQGCSMRGLGMKKSHLCLCFLLVGVHVTRARSAHPTKFSFQLHLAC